MRTILRIIIAIVITALWMVIAVQLSHVYESQLGFPKEGSLSLGVLTPIFVALIYATMTIEEK